MGEKGRARVSGRHTMKVMMENYASAIRGAVESWSRGAAQDA